MDVQIDKKATGEHIKKLLTNKNITITELQQLLDLKHPSIIYRWTKGEAFPTIRHLYIMSLVFRVPIEELLVFDAETSEERIGDLMIWASRKAVNSKYLRKICWECIEILVNHP